MNRGNGKYVRRETISVSYEIHDANRSIERKGLQPVIHTDRDVLKMLDIRVIKISSFASKVSWSK